MTPLPAGTGLLRAVKSDRITSAAAHKALIGYQLPPVLITNLSRQREKRHLVQFGEIPGSLVKAVTSVEDKHFFQHAGFDLARIARPPSGF